MLIDTHAHLNFRDFEKDLDEVIKRSLKAGVEKIICVSSNIADSKKAIKIAEKYPEIVYASVGIHPQQTDPENGDSLEKQIEQLAKLAENPKVVAIGECGLDYSPAPPGEKDRPKEAQLFLFEKQIELAKKLNLPVMIHSREAFADSLDILNKYFSQSKHSEGVLHCYLGGKKRISKIEAINFYFGVDGNLTYDSGLQNVVALIPIEKILLETDSPLLPPVPFRGQRNEPAYTKIVAECLAKIKNLPFDTIAKVTSQSVINLFKIK